MQRKFCYICGNKTEKKQEHLYWCPECQQNYYDNPRPCADLFLVNDKDEILVCRRKHDPGKGMLDISGGFLDFNETYEHAAIREVHEELGLTAKDYSPIQYLESYIADYPWGKETYQTAVVAFVARINADAKPTPMDDVAECFWVKQADIDISQFGFPAQAALAQRAANALRT